MEDLWIVLYDTESGDVWGETVHASRPEAMILALWLTQAAGGAPRYRGAVVPAWMQIPPVSAVLTSATPLFTQWIEGAWPQLEASQPTVGLGNPALTTNGDPIAVDPTETVDDTFITEWIETWNWAEPRIKELSKRTRECDLNEDDPRTRAMMMKCIQATWDQVDLTRDTGRTAITKLLDCWAAELDEYGCKKEGDGLNPWVVGGLVAGGVVLIGGGVWYVSRRA